MQKKGFILYGTCAVLTRQCGHVAMPAELAQTHAGAYMAHRLMVYWATSIVAHKIA